MTASNKQDDSQREVGLVDKAVEPFFQGRKSNLSVPLAPVCDGDGGWVTWKLWDAVYCRTHGHRFSQEPHADRRWCDPL